MIKDERREREREKEKVTGNIIQSAKWKRHPTNPPTTKVACELSKLRERERERERKREREGRERNC